MHLSAFLKFEHFTDSSIREHRFILNELSSVFWNINFTYYASIIPA